MGQRKKVYAAPAAWMVVGAPAWYRPFRGGDERVAVAIRSEPWQLGHGQWVVKVTEYVGGVAIEHLEPREVAA